MLFQNRVTFLLINFAKGKGLFKVLFFSSFSFFPSVTASLKKKTTPQNTVNKT